MMIKLEINGSRPLPSALMEAMLAAVAGMIGARFGANTTGCTTSHQGVESGMLSPDGVWVGDAAEPFIGDRDEAGRARFAYIEENDLVSPNVRSNAIRWFMSGMQSGVREVIFEAQKLRMPAPAVLTVRGACFELGSELGAVVARAMLGVYERGRSEHATGDEVAQAKECVNEAIGKLTAAVLARV